MSMAEESILDRVNGARCMECRDELGEADVAEAVEEAWGDVEELTDRLYDEKRCNCDATMVPMIFSDTPVFDDAEVDDDYRIRGREGQPDRWTYEVDSDLVDRLA